MKRVFVAYKHTGEDPEKLREILTLVKDAFSSVGVEVRCTFFKEDHFKREAMTPRAIMEHAFRIIDDGCDALFVLQSSANKSEGMILEVGYCRAKGVPVIVAVQKGVSNTYLPEMGDHTFSWETPKQLINGIHKYVLDHLNETTATITISSVNWPADREGFFSFRKFLESHGCSWKEGMGAHVVTFPTT